MTTVIQTPTTRSAGSQPFCQRRVNPGAVAGGVGQVQQRPGPAPIQKMEFPVPSGEGMLQRQGSASLIRLYPPYRRFGLQVKRAKPAGPQFQEPV